MPRPQVIHLDLKCENVMLATDPVDPYGLTCKVSALPHRDTSCSGVRLETLGVAGLHHQLLPAVLQTCNVLGMCCCACHHGPGCDIAPDCLQLTTVLVLPANVMLPRHT
jgi:hypothetical protein